MLTKQAATATFKCPTCSSPLWSTARDGSVAVHADLQDGDGDVIPGSPDTLADYACASLAHVQSCPFCLARYWTLDLCLHNGGNDALLDMMAFDIQQDDASYFTFTDSLGGLSLLKTSYTEEPITKHTNGRAVVILAGPYCVTPSDVTHGSNGVSACGGGDFWRKALERLHKELPNIEKALGKINA